MTTCANPRCENPVPEGWEGGYCLACCAEMDRLGLDPPDPVPDNLPQTDLLDPYAEYGIDHPWEL